MPHCPLTAALLLKFYHYARRTIPLPTSEFPRLSYFGIISLPATGVNQQQPPVPSTSSMHSSSSRQPPVPVDQQGAGSTRPLRATAGDRQATTINFQMAEQNQSNVGVADQSRISMANSTDNAPTNSNDASIGTEET
ncbi:hypothetical protein KY289_017081 [Solanum tuberosum]|nr:hypothetical protein KY289_017081 [Solanum tuberosum]